MFPVGVSAGRESTRRARTYFVLGTLPAACVIPVDEVQEVFGSDVSRGDGALPQKTLTMEALGLSGRPGAPGRFLLLVRAPKGPFLHFAAEVAQKELQGRDLLPLPARPFAESLFSALVVQDQHVIGLMLDVERLLSRSV